MAEWSKALHSGCSLFGGVGSNPTPCIFMQEGRKEARKEEVKHEKEGKQKKRSNKKEG